MQKKCSNELCAVYCILYCAVCYSHTLIISTLLKATEFYISIASKSTSVCVLVCSHIFVRCCWYYCCRWRRRCGSCWCCCCCCWYCTQNQDLYANGIEKFNVKSLTFVCGFCWCKILTLVCNIFICIVTNARIGNQHSTIKHFIL